MSDDYFGYIGVLGETLRGINKWAEMKSKLLDKMERIETVNWDESSV